MSIINNTYHYNNDYTNNTNNTNNIIKKILKKLIKTNDIKEYKYNVKNNNIKECIVCYEKTYI